MTGMWFWPRGRVSRKAFALVYFLPALATFLLLEMLARFEGDRELIRTITVAAVWIWAPLMVVGLVKRLHDCGRSGLWAVTVLVPLVGVVPYAIIAFVLAGQGDTNRFGAPPLEWADRRLG